MQYASLAIAKELPVDTLKMMVRAHNQRDFPRSFSDMIFEVRVEGNLTMEQLENLAREASEQCFVENTLAKAIPLTTTVFLNGKKVLNFTRDPADEPPAGKKQG